MIDPALLTRLQAILPGEWTAIRDGYSLATGADTLTVTTPYSQYLVRLGDGDALKTYKAADLPTLIRRVLGDEVFTAIASGAAIASAAAKAERDRRRSALCQRISDASLAVEAAEDALRQAEADLATFDRENAP